MKKAAATGPVKGAPSASKAKVGGSSAVSLAPLAVSQSILNSHDRNGKKASTNNAKKSSNKKGIITGRVPAASVPPIVASKQLSLTELAISRLLLPPDTEGNGCGAVKLRFNHYNKEFPIHNGVLKWSDVDEEYCLSFAYKGDYKRDLYQNSSIKAAESSLGNDKIVDKGPKTAVPAMTQLIALRDEKGDYFLNLIHKEQYMLQLTEDPQQIAIEASTSSLKNKPSITAAELAELNPENQQRVLQSNRAVHLLTQELKGMAVSELGGSEAKDLIERRDLEDILYSASSGGCGGGGGEP